MSWAFGSSAQADSRIGIPAASRSRVAERYAKRFMSVLLHDEAVGAGETGAGGSALAEMVDGRVLAHPQPLAAGRSGGGVGRQRDLRRVGDRVDQVGGDDD